MMSAKRNCINSNNSVRFVAIFAVMGVFFACGGNSGSSANPEDDGREVATVVDMGRCTNEREGDTVYVAEKLTDYLCQNGSWVDLSKNSDKEHSFSSSSSITPNSVSWTSSGKDENPVQGFIRDNISVTGVAQKGPFKFGSPLNLYELKKDLVPSGRAYNDEINSNKGDFVIPKVSLAYPYAKLEVRGLYRNEVTGEWSKDSMTLRALTDFSETRTEVNINLLTHLEYDRVLYLVQEKGYSVYAAKKQAAQEIMTAFEFATAVTCSEDFAVFQNEGVSIATSAGNATLLAVSALVMGNRSDAEIQSVIDKFCEDVKIDGEWNDLQTKADMADWAHDFKYNTIRASVKSWNILDIPAYETYLDIYWNNVYGLGGCSEIRKGIVTPNSNKLSKYYNKYFICRLDDAKYSWEPATTIEKDTYEWTVGKSGDFKKGNVTDTIYAYNGAKWEIAEKETSMGICSKSNAGVVSQFDGSYYYICKNNAWEKATVLEYDTYGWNAGVEGSVKVGNVNPDKYYMYENGSWHYVPFVVDPSTVVKGTMTDSRDGQIYKTVKIGSQIWIAENLNSKTAKSYCYNSASDCGEYGRLYTWTDAAIVCPTGWHLPTKMEFETLITMVGGISIAGEMLKSTSGWFNKGNGKDVFSFSALPAGRIDDGGKYDYESYYTNFWSSTENNSERAYSMYLGCDDYYADLRNYNKNNGFSVRCLQD